MPFQSSANSIYWCTFLVNKKKLQYICAYLVLVLYNYAPETNHVLVPPYCYDFVRHFRFISHVYTKWIFSFWEMRGYVAMTKLSRDAGWCTCRISFAQSSMFIRYFITAHFAFLSLLILLYHCTDWWSLDTRNLEWGMLLCNSKLRCRLAIPNMSFALLCNCIYKKLNQQQVTLSLLHKVTMNQSMLMHCIIRSWHGQWYNKMQCLHFRDSFGSTNIWVTKASTVIVSLGS